MRYVWTHVCTSCLLQQHVQAWVTRSVVKYYIETDLDEPQGEFLRGAADAFETGVGPCRLLA